MNFFSVLNLFDLCLIKLEIEDCYRWLGVVITRGQIVTSDIYVTVLFLYFSVYLQKVYSFRAKMKLCSIKLTISDLWLAAVILHYAKANAIFAFDWENLGYICITALCYMYVVLKLYAVSTFSELKTRIPGGRSFFYEKNLWVKQQAWR